MRQMYSSALCLLLFMGGGCSEFGDDDDSTEATSTPYTPEDGGRLLYTDVDEYTDWFYTDMGLPYREWYRASTEVFYLCELSDDLDLSTQICGYTQDPYPQTMGVLYRYDPDETYEYFWFTCLYTDPQTVYPCHAYDYE